MSDFGTVYPRFDKVQLWNIHLFLSAFDKQIYDEFRRIPTTDQMSIYRLLRDTSAFLPSFMEVYG